MGFWDGSGISWTICKQSAPRSRKITTTTPHHSIFTDQMLFLMPNQVSKHTHTHTQPFNGFWSGTTRVGRYQKKHSPTHTHPDHLPPFTTINGILSVHFTCLTVISYNLSPGPLWSSSWSVNLYFILHTFFHPIIIFLLSYVILLPYAITVI